MSSIASVQGSSVQNSTRPDAAPAPKLVVGAASSQSPAIKAAMSVKERNNWYIHMLYVRQEYDKCLEVIETQLHACNGLCEYAIYVKGLIHRIQGKIQESLSLFQTALALNPNNVANMKQIGRSLYLLGKHKAAIEIFDEAQRLDPEDWEIFHNKGLCFLVLKQFDSAEESFLRSNAIQRHDATYIQLGKVFTHQEKYQEAIDVYLEAIEFSPENPELLTTIGLLYLRLGENSKAFDYLGNSLTHDPRNPKTILAAGSIIQDHNEMDVALNKYRIAAVATPNSAQLWNNIGMCFFGQQNFTAAIACLKRALYLAPFEWIIAYNLGLVHLNASLYASAFHFFSAAINMKPDFASSYMYLAITLSRLEDFENACTAYEKAIEMEIDHVFELNYAITLYNNNETEAALQHFEAFERLYEQLDEDSKASDPAVAEARQLLQSVLPLPYNNNAAAATTTTEAQPPS